MFPQGEPVSTVAVVRHITRAVSTEFLSCEFSPKAEQIPSTNRPLFFTSKSVNVEYLKMTKLYVVVSKKRN